MKFAAQRQRMLAHNIANMDTPDFRPLEVSVSGFRQALSRAVEKRREAGGGEQGELSLSSTKEMLVSRDGNITLRPRTGSPGVLYHDRNNRDVERLMQDVVENTLAFRASADLIRRQNDLLRTAISQRV